MKRALLGFLVLAAILLGTLAAGTPVAGDDSVAATTAGINLSASVRPVSARVATAANELRADPRSSIVVLVLTGLSLLWVLRLLEPRLDLVRASAHRRRGPPARS